MPSCPVEWELFLDLPELQGLLPEALPSGCPLGPQAVVLSCALTYAGLTAAGLCSLQALLCGAPRAPSLLSTSSSAG